MGVFVEAADWEDSGAVVDVVDDVSGCCFFGGGGDSDGFVEGDVDVVLDDSGFEVEAVYDDFVVVVYEVSDVCLFSVDEYSSCLDVSVGFSS